MGFRGWGKPFVNEEGWQAFPLGNSRYVFYYPESAAKKITLSGSADSVYCTIPFPFRLNKIVLSHNDSTVRSVLIQILLSKIPEVATAITIYWEAYDIDTDEIIKFEENENEWDINDKIKLTLNGTLNKTCSPIIFVQGLK